jgi:hypothetical protein
MIRAFTCGPPEVLEHVRDSRPSQQLVKVVPAALVSASLPI